MKILNRVGVVFALVLGGSSLSYGCNGANGSVLITNETNTSDATGEPAPIYAYPVDSCGNIVLENNAPPPAIMPGEAVSINTYNGWVALYATPAVDPYSELCSYLYVPNNPNPKNNFVPTLGVLNVLDASLNLSPEFQRTACQSRFSSTY